MQTENAITLLKPSNLADAVERFAEVHLNPDLAWGAADEDARWQELCHARDVAEDLAADLRKMGVAQAIRAAPTGRLMEERLSILKGAADVAFRWEDGGDAEKEAHAFVQALKL